MKMKSKISIVLLIALLSSMWAVCFATENEIGETIPQEGLYEDVEYLDDYQQYEDLMTDASSEYSQEELKEYYDFYNEEMKKYFNEYEREETVKAKVIDVKPVQERYEFNDYYYSASKYHVQPIKVEIMEGENIGKEFEIGYLLTGDSLGNIEYSELKIGDTIFVGFYTDETTGELVADITNAGANVERLGVIVCIGIMAIILLTIYGGKKGLLTSLIILLALDFSLLLVPIMGYEGNGFVIPGIAFILLLISTMVISRLGLTKKAIKAGGISIVLTLVSWLLLTVATYLTRTVGITFEVAAIAENVVLRNMDFSSLYVITTLIIIAVAIVNVVCNALKRIEESNVEGFNERLEICKPVLNENVIMSVVILLATYIPNHLLLLTNKYTPQELWNAELLVVELVRICVLIISVSLAIPAVVAIKEDERVAVKKTEEMHKEDKKEEK